MNVRLGCLLLCLAAPAAMAADAPAVPAAPPAMPDWNKIVNIFGGTWTSEYDNKDTDFSKPGHVSSTVEMHCHLAGDATQAALTCVHITNGRLGFAYVFTRDAASGAYKLMSLAGSRDPLFATFSVGDDNVVILFDQPPDKQNNTFHWRFTRKLNTDGTAQISTEVKKNDGKWETTQTGTDKRTAPAGPAPSQPIAALDNYGAQWVGNWNVSVENYSSEFSQAGSKSYQMSRGCYRDGDTLRCLGIGNQRLGSEVVLSYDAASGEIHQHAMGGDGRVDDFRITVTGNTRISLTDIKDKDGNTIHWRDTSVYKDKDTIETRREFNKEPGNDWITVTTETEARGKPAGG